MDLLSGESADLVVHFDAAFRGYPEPCTLHPTPQVEPTDIDLVPGDSM